MLTREHVLLVKKKESMEGKISSKTTMYEVKLVFVSSPQPLPHTDDWIASFYIALFKSSNYGNYVCVATYAFHITLKLKRVQTSNEKGFDKNRVIRTATKRTETSA